MKLAIFGAGGLGREILVLLRQAKDSFPQGEFVGWFDDTMEVGQKVMNYPVLGGLSELNAFEDSIGVFWGLGDSRTKRKVASLITNSNVHYPNLVHPDVALFDEQDIRLGKGVVIQKGCALTTNISMGDFSFLNLNCTVGHDTNIGPYSSFMPGVHISGSCDIGEAAYFGTNASIINGVNIGDGVLVGAGACVTKSLEGHTVNVGVPTKSIKQLEAF